MISRHRLPAALLAVALLGCPTDPPDPTGDDDSGTPADDDDDDTTAPPAGLEVEVEISAVIPTVATLRWNTDEPTTATLECMGNGAPSWTLQRDEASTDHEVVVRGLRANTSYECSVRAFSDGLPFADRMIAIVTGGPPPSVPDLDVELLDAAGAPQGNLLTSMLAAPLTVVVIDTDGHYLWWYFDERSNTAIGRVMLAADGSGILYDAFPTYGSQPDDPVQEIVWVSWDGNATEAYEIPGAHHDFTQLPDGTLATLAEDRRDVEGTEIIGDKITERAPDGTLTDVWSTWDDIPYDPDAVPPGPDWTHCGALDYEPDEDAYYLSSHNLHTLWKVDRASGELVWSFGGAHSDFTLAGDGEFPYHLHQFDVLDAGVLVFDNNEPAALASRVVEYAFDGFEATEVWQYAADPPLYNFAMGDVQRFDSGLTHVTWSVAGQVDVVDPDAALTWQLNTELGSGLSYGTWVDSLY
jgi:hypothetical protein